jgi:ribose transport system permease protein
MTETINTPTLPPKGRGLRWNGRIRSRDPYVFILLIALAVVVAFFAFSSPVFATPGNAVNLMQEVSIAGIIAMGMMVVLLCGDVDLSVGAVAGFSAALAVTLQGLGTPLAIVLALIVCAGIGVLQGVIAVITGVHSLIVTLATLTLLRGVVLVMTGGFPQAWEDNAISGALWNRNGLPIPFLLFVLVTVIVYVMLNWTKQGTSFYAVGGNAQSASEAGISVARTRITAFALSGLFAGAGGILLMTRLHNASPTAGTGWELTAISAVVIGGVSLMGGKGKVSGVIIGAFLLAIIANGMNLLGISSYYQQIVQGVLIVLATGISSFRLARS